jgi:hypothetical protein
MPERLKQKTNDEFFEVKPLGEESLMEMKAARCGIARLLIGVEISLARISRLINAAHNQSATQLL